MSFVICAYYIGKHYEVCAKYLKADCEKFGYEYDIVAPDVTEFAKKKILGVNLWRWYCRYKPRFVIEMLEKHNKPILILDVDGRIRSEFDLNMFDGYKIGLCRHDGEFFISNVVVSCIAFRPDPVVMDFLKLWEYKCMMVEEDESDHLFFKTTLLDFFSHRRINIGYLDRDSVFASKRDIVEPKILINARKYRRR